MIFEISDIKCICTNVALSGQQYSMLATNQAGLDNDWAVFGGVSVLMQSQHGHAMGGGGGVYMVWIWV